MNRHLKWMTSAVVMSLGLMLFFHVQTYQEFMKKKLARVRLMTSHNLNYSDVESLETNNNNNEEQLVYINKLNNAPTKAEVFSKTNSISHFTTATSTKRALITTTIATSPNGNKPLCDDTFDSLYGALQVNSNTSKTLEEAIETGGAGVIQGCYEPVNCRATERVAIVIPYKERYKHLLTLLHHMHPILKRQKRSYCVFVAEQFDDGIFNKARIMNAAFVHITQNFDFDCFVFHDVDMLLEDDRNIYSCGDSPKHMSPAIDKFNYTLDYGTKFGGVTAIRTDHYRLVNGHSNRYWGWGGEDNDMERRIALKNLTIHKVNSTFGRYKMITHEHPWWFNPGTGTGSHVTLEKKLKEIYRPEVNVDPSGVSTIKFSLVGTEPKTLWTKFMFDIRDYAVEKVSVTATDSTKREAVIEVQRSELFYHKSFQPVNTSDYVESKHGSSNPMVRFRCEPTYLKLSSLTINRTKGTNEVYTKVYSDFDEAKKDCNKLDLLCYAILEQIRGKFSLRSTALAHENVLVYKYGIDTQYDVTESHHTTAVYVKVCEDDPNFIQFFPEPLLIHGGVKATIPPRYTINLIMKTYNGELPSFTFRYRIVSTHQAVMEEKAVNKIIATMWWDSLSQNQRGRRHLSSPPSGQGNTRGQLVHIQSPASTLVRHPGCYLATGWLVDEETGGDVFEWRWWFQVRAENKEEEEAFIKQGLETSLRIGREYNEMMAERQKAIESAKAQNKKRKTNDSDSAQKKRKPRFEKPKT